MNIRIYQINTKRDPNRICFMDYEHLEQFQGSKEIDSKIYDKIYEADVDCKTLEDVYQLFNLSHPADYHGRSLSVSDIVEVCSSENVTPGFYFCDSFGFQEVQFDPSKTQEAVRGDRIKVLLVQPDKYPKLIEIGNDLESMQKVVQGDIEEYMPFDDDVAIICNDEGKFNGMRPNRAVYIDPQEVEMTYGELASKFREAEQTGKDHLTGYIVFSSDSFDKPYSEEARTYVVSSNNKAFQPNMGGYSIYGSSLDGSDLMVRLERYMASEKGGKDGWKIERCYMKGTEKEMIDLICGDFFICYAPIDSEKFLSLPDDLARKYKDMFKYPERFFQTENGIKAVPFKPIQRDNER